MKSGWPIKPLGDVVEYQRGLTYAKGDEVDTSDNIVLRATNIDLNTNLLDLTELRYISDKIVVPASKKVKKHSLMICTASGSKTHLGKVAYIDDDYGYAFGGFMGMVTAKPGLLPRYLFHLMTSGDYKDFIAALSDGANINNLKFDDLSRFPIPLPPLAEQQRIVGILDEAFAAIATAKANTEKNLANANAVFASASDSILAGCTVATPQRLEEVVASDCTLSYGIVQPGEEQESGLLLVRPVDLGPKYIYATGLKRIDASRAKGYTRTQLQGNELLLCVRGTTGTVGVTTDELKGGNVTRGLVPVRFNSKIVRRDFGYYLLKCDAVQNQIRAKTYGAALMQINIKDVRDLSVRIPSLVEQDRVVKKLDVLERDTQRLESIAQQRLAALDALKASLLHDAFTGQLTKPSTERAVATA